MEGCRVENSAIVIPEENDCVRKLKILVVAGDEGNANAGDQAMFLGLVRHLNSLFPDAQIISLSKHPRHVLDVPGVGRYYGAYDYLLAERGRISRFVEHHIRGGKMLVGFTRACLMLAGAAFLKRGLKPFFISRSARALIDTLRNVDIVISCGGGYLNSIWRYDGILAFSAIYRLACALGKPLVLTGQGIGPINSRIDGKILRWGLRGAKLIGLRDSGEGLAYLTSLGLPEDIISSPGDDASNLPVCSEEELARVIEVERIPRQEPLVIAQFRPTSHSKDYREEYDILASVLDAIVDRFGYHVVFVPIAHHEYCDDRMASFAVSIRMRNRWKTTVVGGHYRPEVTKALIGMGTVAVGVSYHFGLFSLMQGVPFFSLYENEYYRLKFRGLYGHFGGYDWALPFQPGVADMIVRNLETVLADKARISKELVAYAQQMRERVDAFYKLIPPLLQEATRKHGAAR